MFSYLFFFVLFHQGHHAMHDSIPYIQVHTLNSSNFLLIIISSPTSTWYKMHFASSRGGQLKLPKQQQGASATKCTFYVRIITQLSTTELTSMFIDQEILSTPSSSVIYQHSSTEVREIKGGLCRAYMGYMYMYVL